MQQVGRLRYPYLLYFSNLSANYGRFPGTYKYRVKYYDGAHKWKKVMVVFAIIMGVIMFKFVLKIFFAMALLAGLVFRFLLRPMKLRRY